MKGLKVNREGFEILNGGFAVADTDGQCVEALVKMTAGHAGNAPLVGVGIFNYANAPRSHSVLNALKKQIKLSLKRDAANAETVDVGDFPNIKISAQYE